MGALLVLLVLTAPPSPTRRYDASQLGDLEALVPVLRRHTAHVRTTRPAPFGREPEELDGFGVVLGPRRVVVLAHVVEGATAIQIAGPRGRPVAARAVAVDLERRVAVLEAATPLASAGLEPVRVASGKKRAPGAAVFALSGTDEGAVVMSGEILRDSLEPELEGHLRTDLKLSHGSPVFDDEASFVGYARTLAWDKDHQLLVTPEMITAVLTSSAAAAAPAAPPGAKTPRAGAR